MKYCGKCGAENTDVAMFCRNCGNSLNTFATSGSAANQPYAQPTMGNAPTGGYAPYGSEGAYVLAGEPIQKNNNAKKIGIIATILAVLAVAVILFAVFGVFGSTRSYESVIETYWKATFSGDVEEQLNCVFTKELQNAYFEEMGGSKREAIEEIESDMEYALEYLEEHEFKYKGLKIKDVDDLDEDEIEEIQDFYDEATDRNDISRIKIRDAKRVKTQITLEMDGLKESKEIETVVIKIGEKWYLSAKDNNLYGGISSIY